MSLIWAPPAPGAAGHRGNVNALHSIRDLPWSGPFWCDLTRSIVTEHSLTMLMLIHKMRQALSMGNRLAMVHRGRAISDARGKDKAGLTGVALLDKFQSQADAQISDRMPLG